MLKTLLPFFSRRLATICVSLLIGAAVGVGWGHYFLKVSPSWSDQHDSLSGYTFISPLLACADPSLALLENKDADALQKRLEDFVSGAKARGDIADAGIYFRQLNGGPWVGVNQETVFTPASLLKVPLAISVFRAVETDPALLSKKIAYSPDASLAAQHFPAHPLAAGSYSINDLVAQTLENSDNNAALTLAAAIPSDQLFDSYTHLGVTAPALGQDYATTVRKYASFFRILYNATYLSHDNSEKLLSLLSKSAFTQGIVGGVPTGTIVAHKFGERSIENSNIVQLHDCGIIYAPDGPYILCIMMRGTDFDTLSRSIIEISKIVYGYAN